MGLFRGEIYLIQLHESYNNVLRGKHPVVILSNYLANIHSPLVTVVPITSKLKDLPTRVKLTDCGLNKISYAVCEQVQSINRKNLIHKIGEIDKEIMEEIEKALKIQLEIREEIDKERVDNMVRNITEISNFINETNCKNLGLLRSLHMRELELDNYCKRFGVNYKDYLTA